MPDIHMYTYPTDGSTGDLWYYEIYGRAGLHREPCNLSIRYCSCSVHVDDMLALMLATLGGFNHSSAMAG